MRVRWTEPAVADLHRICDQPGRPGPKAATRERLSGCFFVEIFLEAGENTPWALSSGRKGGGFIVSGAITAFMDSRRRFSSNPAINRSGGLAYV
jgi:hypothetical protein